MSAFFYDETTADHNLDLRRRIDAAHRHVERLEAERNEVEAALDEQRGTRHLLLARLDNLNAEIDDIEDWIDAQQAKGLYTQLDENTIERIKEHLRAMLSAIPKGEKAG